MEKDYTFAETPTFDSQSDCQEMNDGSRYAIDRAIRLESELKMAKAVIVEQNEAIRVLEEKVRSLEHKK